jgi:hypothetical protein
MPSSWSFPLRQAVFMGDGRRKCLVNIQWLSDYYIWSYNGGDFGYISKLCIICTSKCKNVKITVNLHWNSARYREDFERDDES